MDAVPARTRDVYVGLGSNIDEPALQLRRGLVALDALPETRVLRVSRLYLTPPWGLVEQPEFVNAVAEIETALAPQRLVQEMLGVEQAAGRTRDAVRWGPRRLDLDLLVYASTVVDAPGCRVPHPRLSQRAFVLVPLSELAPRLRVPGLGSVAALLAALPAEEVAGVTPEPALTGG